MPAYWEVQAKAPRPPGWSSFARTSPLYPRWSSRYLEAHYAMETGLELNLSASFTTTPSSHWPPLYSGYGGTDPKRDLGKKKRKSECGVVGVYKVTWKCKLSKNNRCDMQRGWNLEDPLGSPSIYWHLLCASCCARAGKFKDESDRAPEHLGPLIGGVGGVNWSSHLREEGLSVCETVWVPGRIQKKPSPHSSFLMTLSRSGPTLHSPEPSGRWGCPSQLPGPGTQ